MKDNGNGQPLMKMRNSHNYPALLEGSIKWYKQPVKLRQRLPNIGLSYDPAIQLPKYMYMNVYNSLFANSHLSDVRGRVTVVLTCISLMMSNTEYLFMYLFVMYISLKKCLFRSVHFLIRLLVVCFCLLFPVELYEFFLYFGCHLQIFFSIQ